MISIKKLIKKNRVLYKLAHAVHAPIAAMKLAYKRRPVYKRELALTLNQMDLLSTGKKTVWFCGVPTHNNLGDQAQANCIRKWVSDCFGGEYRMVELLAFPFYSKKFKKELDKMVSPDDIFVIQSGYCTTELHYNHYMHRYIVDHFENPILIMPQTVNFHKEKEGFKTGTIYKKHKKLLFLARDRQSFEYAEKYFSGCKILLYPDIVTCMIGTKSFKKARSGVLLCIRNDGEKLYTEEQIRHLCDLFRKKGIHVELTDTNYSDNEKKEDVGILIDRKIEQFSTYKVIITDRYHGTIFSMVANTPVIVLATNDHKVKTGTEWFEGKYDGAFYNANSIEEAYDIAMKIILKGSSLNNEPYFKEKYYDKLYNEFLKAMENE